MLKIGSSPGSAVLALRRFTQGHAPGELISGQTMIVKTTGKTVDQAVLTPARAVACTLGAPAQKSGSQSPGTRGKMVAMLRAELIKAQEYQAKVAASAEKKEGAEPPPRDLNMEAWHRSCAANWR